MFAKYFENCGSVNECKEIFDNLNNSGELFELKNKLINSTDKNEKQEFGKQLNLLKQSLKQAFGEKITELQKEAEKDNFTSFDPSFHLLQKPISGDLHPLTKVSKEILEIFQNMGFNVADGPLVETQWHCMTTLNIPDYHPARAMQDTFYLKQKDEYGENLVLRTHTSAMQIRYGLAHKPPIYIVAPGQVYRNENIDATHDVMFHQIECLIVDKIVSVSHLKTLALEFFRKFLGDDKLQIRLRTSYFSYTVPSMEVDIFLNNKWMEVGGAGLVHPDVIKNIGLNPDEWQGLAFGFGIDRMATIKLGFHGIGQMFEGDLNFLRGYLTKPQKTS